MDPVYEREMRLEGVSLEEAYERMRVTYDRLAAENAELRAGILPSQVHDHSHYQQVKRQRDAANATLDALREAVPNTFTTENSHIWRKSLYKVRNLLYPQPAALAEEKKKP